MFITGGDTLSTVVRTTLLSRYFLTHLTFHSQGGYLLAVGEYRFSYSHLEHNKTVAQDCGLQPTNNRGYMTSMVL